MENYNLFKIALAVVATVGLYTVLYRENKFYRFWEHVFVGLASGWALVAIWTESLRESWWERMIGTPATAEGGAEMGYWLYAILLPIGLMGYFVFSRKHNWISRVPIGIILGFYSGQQFQAWQNRYVPQIDNTLKPILPTTFQFFKTPPPPGTPPAEAARLASQLTISQALSNLIFVVTVLSVLSYFLFSFDVKNKILQRTSLTGRWLLMIGFGAIFGSTVMMRFTLLIDRMYFIWIEFVRDGLGRLFGG
jgi:hypothetical protein